jgi:hypothetical protein
MGLLALGELLAVFEQIVCMHVLFLCFTWCLGMPVWFNIPPVLRTPY